MEDIADHVLLLVREWTDMEHMPMYQTCRTYSTMPNGDSPLYGFLHTHGVSIAQLVIIPWVSIAFGFILSIVLGASSKQWGRVLAMAAVSLGRIGRSSVQEIASEKFALPMASIPKHIAIIMDGNRRYGRKFAGGALNGHAAGGETLSKCIDWCMEFGVEVLTVYAFSTGKWRTLLVADCSDLTVHSWALDPENWNRPQAEIECILRLFMENIPKLQKKALERNTRVRIITSDPHRLPAEVQEPLRSIETMTLGCTGFQVNVCVSYGGRAEIARACQDIARKAMNHELEIADINESCVASHLLTRDIQDPDLLIRTSGECRVSNFLLYQLAYSEFMFLNKTWPELTKKDLYDAIATYARRNRRFGR